MAELFKESEVSTIPLPDLRKVPDYKYLFGNIKTNICGLKKGCEIHVPDCKYYCAKKEK